MLEIYQHRHAVKKAYEQGETCGGCFRPFKAGEAVWIAPVEAFQSTYLPPVCGTCKPPHEAYAPPRQCVVCQWAMYEPVGNRRALLPACSGHCRAKLNAAIDEDDRRQLNRAHDPDRLWQLIEDAKHDRLFCRLRARSGEARL